MAKQRKSLQTRLVLFDWFKRQLGIDSFDCLKQCDAVLNSNDNHTLCYENIRDKAKDSILNELKKYDDHIIEITNRINYHRSSRVVWTYFQYLTLLASELYLDLYFNDKNGLKDSINEVIEEHNNSKRDNIPLIDDVSELAKLAFWISMGGGKTLLMHAHYYQFMYWSQNSKLDNIILLTPNENLSNQHKIELNDSGIDAELFDKSGSNLFTSSRNGYPPIKIIDINKLTTDPKVVSSTGKTMLASSFRGNNLVFIDEGHSGLSSASFKDTDAEWINRRRELCEGGFSFEYSATFGQAVDEGKTGAVCNEYAKSILFSYSYQDFYDDHYGKDYNILNLSDSGQELESTQEYLYLTAALLCFYQQLLCYSNTADKAIRQYNIHKPLWIFVGTTVVRTSKGDLSDVIKVLKFLSDFVNNSKDIPGKIKDLLTDGLENSNSQDVLSGKLDCLKKYIGNDPDYEQLYCDIKQKVFNVSSGNLKITEIERSNGEFLLSLDNNDPFGMITVGDAESFRKKLNNSGFTVIPDKISNSRFRDVEDDKKSFNILIGAKKFIEGWNCYRVSSMGLINFGKGKGVQAVQLFGRGIRLKGMDGKLKRDVSANVDPKIKILETLSIFGVKSNYMKAFIDSLKDVAPIDNVFFPVTDRFKSEITAKLKLPVFKNDDPDAFSNEGPTLSFVHDAAKNLHIELNLMPQISAYSNTKTASAKNNAVNSNDFDLRPYVSFFDITRIYFALEEYKSLFGWTNLNISRSAVNKLLNDKKWYTLYLDSPHSFSDILKLENVATRLLQKLMKKYYITEQNKWNRKHNMEYAALNKKYPNDFVSKNDNGYGYWIKASSDAIGHIKPYIEQFTQNPAQNNSSNGVLTFIDFDRHLYYYLLSQGQSNQNHITANPQLLNQGEKDFVEKLKAYCGNNQQTLNGKEIYLLRNTSRGYGVGFFTGAGFFYPDFILWIVDGQKQYISFIDPKGIVHSSNMTSAKVKFSSAIKEIQKALNDPDISLNSFVLSVTPQREVSQKWNDLFEENGGIFMDDECIEKIIDRTLTSP